MSWLTGLVVAALLVALYAVYGQRRAWAARLAERDHWLDVVLAAPQEPLFTWEVERDRIVWTQPHARIAGRPCVDISRIEHLFALLEPTQRTAASDGVQAALRNREPAWSRELRFANAPREAATHVLRLAFRHGPTLRTTLAAGSLHELASPDNAEHGPPGVELLLPLVESLPDPVALLDAELRFVLVNGAFAALVGRTAADLVGELGDTLLPPDSAGEISDLQREVLERGETIERDEPWLRGDGRLWRVRRARLTDAGGNRYLLTTAAEVTALTHARDAFRNSQDAAAIGSLMGSFAHGGNNRLTVILSCLDMIDGPGLPTPEQREAVELAQGAARNLAGDLSALLTGARRFMLPPRANEIASSLESARRLHDLVADRPLVVASDVPAGLQVEAEGHRLDAALLRMLTFARRRHATTVRVRGTLVELAARSPEQPLLRKGRYCCLEFELVGATLPERLLRSDAEPGHVLERLRDPDGLEFAAVEAFVVSLRGQVYTYGGAGVHPKVQLYLPLAPGA